MTIDSLRNRDFRNEYKSLSRIFEKLKLFKEVAFRKIKKQLRIRIKQLKQITNYKYKYKNLVIVTLFSYDFIEELKQDRQLNF